MAKTSEVHLLCTPFVRGGNPKYDRNVVIFILLCDRIISFVSSVVLNLCDFVSLVVVVMVT